MPVTNLSTDPSRKVTYCEDAKCMYCSPTGGQYGLCSNPDVNDPYFTFSSVYNVCPYRNGIVVATEPDNTDSYYLYLTDTHISLTDKLTASEHIMDVDILQKLCKLASDELAHLSRYRDLEEDRRLMELPMSLGSTVYQLRMYRDKSGGFVVPYTVAGIHIYNNPGRRNHPDTQYVILETPGVVGTHKVSLREVGRTLFADKDTAEAALDAAVGHQEVK